MKVYSDVITESNVYEAFRNARQNHKADIWEEDVRSFKPRKTSGFTHAIEFFASSMNGHRATGHRPIGSYPLDGEDRAASWSDYGYVIAYLFKLDSNARIGRYNNLQDFRDMIANYPRKGQSTAFMDILDGE